MARTKQRETIRFYSIQDPYGDFSNFALYPISFWGDGGDGSAKNMLGRVLMDVREASRGAASQ